MSNRFFVEKKTDAPFAFFLLCIYIILVLIRPHEMSTATNTWSIIKYCAILTFLTTLFSFRPLKLYPQHWLYILLMPLIILSSFVNGSGMWGVTESINFLSASIIPLFLISNCTSTIKRQHWLMIICLTAAMFIVHNGYIQQSDILWNGWALNTHALPKFGTEMRRITYLGFFNDPNDIGMFLVMNIPFAIYFFHYGTTFKKLLMLAVLSLLIYGMWMTHSRGTALGAAALVAFYFLITKAGTKVFIAAIVTAPVAIVVLTLLTRNVDQSANGRLEAWYAGILMLTSYPLGIGKGAFVDHHGLTAHNSYILVAGELGFLGYCLWGGALLLTVITAYFYIKKIDITKVDEKLKEELVLNRTLFFSLIGFMITGFFLSRSYAIVLFIFIGMSIASQHRIINLKPELNQYATGKFIFKSIKYSWFVIFAVYVSLKVAL
jgi:hypothetical protein